MTTTTSYGTWTNHGDAYNVTVEATIADAVSGGDTDWRERFETSGAAGRVADDYRAAINKALPEGITLAGNDFYGPFQDTPDWWDGIEAAIKSVDLMAIVDRHDPDNA